MRSVNRVVLRALDAGGGGGVLACVAVVAFVILLLLVWQLSVSAAGFGAGAYLVDLGLLVLLGAAFLVWRGFLARRAIRSDTAAGLLLAAFGLAARFWCDFSVNGLAGGLGFVHDGRSVLESAPDAHLRMMLQVLRWGGLAAFVLGLAFTALMVVSDVRGNRRGRLRR